MTNTDPSPSIHTGTTTSSNGDKPGAAAAAAATAKATKQEKEKKQQEQLATTLSHLSGLVRSRVAEGEMAAFALTEQVCVGGLWCVYVWAWMCGWMASGLLLTK
jgi:hypothetical protein